MICQVAMHPIPVPLLPKNLLPLHLMRVIYWSSVPHFHMNYVYKTEAALNFATRHSTHFKSLICIINIFSITGSLDNQQHNTSSPSLRSLSISVVYTVPPEPGWPHPQGTMDAGLGKVHTGAHRHAIIPSTQTGQWKQPWGHRRK